MSGKLLLLLLQPSATARLVCLRPSYRCFLPFNSKRALSSVASPEVVISTPGQGVKLPGLAMNGQQQQMTLTLEQTLEVVKIPPSSTNPGARVEHIEVTADGQLSDVVSAALQLPRWFVLELIRFGAIHYSPIMPPPAAAARPRMSQKYLQHVEALRAAGIAKLGRNPELQHPKRVIQDVPVVAGGYVRVHVHPKRFPAAYSVEWRRAILADTPEYVVVDKPAGVQVPPTVDNLLESVVCCTAQALGLPHDALLNTHRLDAGTSGVVLLAKNSNFAAWFNALLREKPDNVVKMYRCLTAQPPPLGSMVHYATMRARAAGEPAHTRMRRPAVAAAAGAPATAVAESAACAGPGGADAGMEEGARCELVVLQVDQIPLTGKAAGDWGATAYETTLQLVTGRTHQIRAQMAAEGCALLGDQLYQALAVKWQQEQQGCQLPKPQQQQQQEVQQQQEAANHQAGPGWGRIYQEDPLRPIGLQAYMLRVRDMDGRMSGTGVLQQQDSAIPEVQQEQQQADCQDEVANGAPPDPCPGQWWKEQQQQHSHISAGGSAACSSTAGWVEFCTGVPWWRS